MARAFTLGGAGALAVGAVLLAVAIGAELGPLAGLGVLLGLGGLGALAAASLLLGRADHRLLRTSAGRVRDLADRVERLEAAVAAAGDTTVLEQRLDAARDDVLATLDARILGLHETVRELHRGGQA